ncbi:MAG: alpha-hydroxy-acid oxidizing protein [Clostridiales Family XIII bacterium]|nr:alpha-hydroxy-acid oxidizing protein [Clostridiales Family XIII bacterium]
MIGKLLERGNQVLLEKQIDFAGRAETNTAVRFTREYFDSLGIEIRMIDAAPAVTETVFFKKTYTSPIMPAALSGLNGVCKNGLVETAKGAARAGVPMWIGIGEEAELEEAVETGADVVKIIKPYRDEDLILEKIKQAEKHGAVAVGMDTIFGFGGKKGDSLIRPDLMSPKSLSDLRRYVSATHLPFIVKGVLSVEDAEKAVDAGAAGIVLSNHSGSVLDYALPPLMVLPEIEKAISHSVTIFIDGGFTRGTDAFKALALGADGILLGRAVICGLAADGADGVHGILSGVNEELRRVMSVAGCPDVKHIHSGLVRRTISLPGAQRKHLMPAK